MTWGDVGACFAVIVVGGFIAGFVETWWEQRKRDKEQNAIRKGGESLLLPYPEPWG